MTTENTKLELMSELLSEGWTDIIRNRARKEAERREQLSREFLERKLAREKQQGGNKPNTDEEDDSVIDLKNGLKSKQPVVKPITRTGAKPGQNKQSDSWGDNRAAEHEWSNR